jgi:hypothetical protein
VKALAIRQPWASLIAAGVKVHETRSWSTGYRGTLLIYAARDVGRGGRSAYGDLLMHLVDEMHDDELEAVLRHGQLLVGQPARDDRSGLVEYMPLERPPRGRVIAVCDLIAIHPASERALQYPDDERFGDYGEGRWAWELATVRPLARPTLWRGGPEMWEVPADLKSAVQAELAATAM